MAKEVIHIRESKTSIVEVLNEASLQLLEIKEENEIYKILASAIAKIIPGTYCTVSKLRPDKINFRIVQMYGVDKFLPSIKLILGKDPYEVDFPYIELAKGYTPAFESRKIFRFEDGLYGISAGSINRTICTAIEKLIGMSAIYTTCFYLDGIYYGGLTLIIPKRVLKSGIINPDAFLAIETLSNLATVLIHKLQVNEEMKKSKMKLQEEISKKDKFFSIIAHDLKSPFNSFIGFTEILSDQNNTISEEKRTLYINLLHESAVSTYKLLDNLLEWSRLHLGNYEIHKERIFLKCIIDDCISLYRAAAENKKIAIINQVTFETSAYVDENSINTVLRNLLNNALKYTPEDGQITFSATQKQNEVEISVQDTGLGIKPELLDKLFNIGDSTSTLGTKNEKGTGIGLVLCKELLDKNGGTIQVVSEVGKGTTFTLALPNKPNDMNGSV
jgi:signal transduction histidine kinase